MEQEQEQGQEEERCTLFSIGSLVYIAQSRSGR